MKGTDNLGLLARSNSTRVPKAVKLASSGRIARAAYVQELRKLVTEGKYKVEPQKLALKIMVRALKVK